MDIIEHLKSINILKVNKNISLDWEEISQMTIQHSWKKLIPEVEENGSGENENLPPSNSEFVADLLSLVSADVQEEDVEEWLSSDDLGYQHLGDEQIVAMVIETNVDQQEHDTCSSESEDEVTVTSISACPVSNKEAVQLFEKCMASTSAGIDSL